VVHRVRGLKPTRFFGLGGLSQRGAFALYRRGLSLLRNTKNPFDLVFFSTTEFQLHALGLLWKRKTGVPFCMDYQDPWVNYYYKDNPGIKPPGGRIKYGVTSFISRILEPMVVRESSGFIGVSEKYLDSLVARYGGDLAAPPRLVEPFPAEPSEMNGARDAFANPASSEKLCIRYVGRGGEDMKTAISVFYQCWVEFRKCFKKFDIFMEAVGTSYAISGSQTKMFEAEALKLGLGSFVRETTTRVPYRDALSLLAGSDGIVVFGSDDPAYTASKLYPCLLAGRPMLAILHENCPAVAFLRSVGGCDIALFGDGVSCDNQKGAIHAFLHRVYNRSGRVPLNYLAFNRFTAESQAIRVGHWLNAVLAFSKK
jgi:hypothetical protein